MVVCKVIGFGIQKLTSIVGRIVGMVGFGTRVCHDNNQKIQQDQEEEEGQS